MAAVYGDSSGVIFTLLDTIEAEMTYEESIMAYPDYARRVQFDEITNSALIDAIKLRMSDFTIDGSSVLYDGASPATVYAPSGFYTRFYAALPHFANLMAGVPLDVTETQEVVWLLMTKAVSFNWFVVPETP